MKNKKQTNEQDLSLFDTQGEAMPEAEADDSEIGYEAEEQNTDENNPETVFVEDIAEDIEEPYYDEDDVVVPDSDGEDNGDAEEAPEEAEDDTEPEDEGAPLPEPESDEPTKEVKAPSHNEDKPRRVDSIFDFIELFVFTLAAVFIITSFFFKYSNVVGDSMQNTLQTGEKLLLRSFLYTPKPGDVVVVDDRSLDDPIVKRVIAIGGQTVKITKDAIYVDGEMLEEDYVFIDNCRVRPGAKYHYSVVPSDELIDNVIGYKEGEYYEIRVPENEIFVMGDHRDNSSDSRDIGTLHEDSVLGKAVLRFYPFDKFGKID